MKIMLGRFFSAISVSVQIILASRLPRGSTCNSLVRGALGYLVRFRRDRIDIAGHPGIKRLFSADTAPLLLRRFAHEIHLGKDTARSGIGCGKKIYSSN